MTVRQMARMGGEARAKTLSPSRRSEIASLAGKASGRSRARKAARIEYQLPELKEKHQDRLVKRIEL